MSLLEFYTRGLDTDAFGLDLFGYIFNIHPQSKHASKLKLDIKLFNHYKVSQYYDIT